jgi:hypothetical protein
LQRFRGGTAGHRFEVLGFRAQLQSIDFPPVFEKALQDGKGRGQLRGESAFCSLRLSVRTPPFHGGESGSIPLGSANDFKGLASHQRFMSSKCPDIEFAVNNQNASSAWVLGQPADPALSAISVFDSRTASVHVDDVNDVAYTPFPLRILGHLAKLCQDPREKLNAEVKQLEAQTPQAIRQPPCPPDSEVGRLLARLGRSLPEEVRKLAELAPAEADRLAQLNGDLASDPDKLGRQLAPSRTGSRVSAAARRNQSPDRAILLGAGREEVWKNSHHGQGALAADLGRHHHLRRLGCCRHNRQRVAPGLDADGLVSNPNRFHQFL